MIDWTVVWTLAGKEVRDAVRNRWLWLMTGAFSALATGAVWLSLAGSSIAGGGGYGRATAVMVNLVLFFAPLMGLTIGASALAGERERGTLLTLLAQPVSKADIFLAKMLGLSVALLAATAVSFALAALTMAGRGGGDAAAMLTLALATALLVEASLALGLLVSALSSRVVAAVGAAIVLWLALTVLTDLGLMTGAMAFRLRAPALFGAAVVSPLQAFKLLVIASATNAIDTLGPVGVYARRTLGAALPAALVGSLTAWTLLPLTAAGVVFCRRSAA
ncbi:MAG: ABC transporter permease [Planctomycetota bacterium]|nr:MAG: ABC transporter permease [Planctomycetota bacterium]